MEFTKVEIEEYSGYSYVSKYIYRDKDLSLKAKGLMSLFSSLPDNWNFTEAGLAAINSDGVASIKSTVKELKEKKYLKVYRKRLENGRLGESCFEFYRIPYDSKPEQQFTELQTSDETTNIRLEEIPVSIMSNYHLRDNNLSLKGKGLLSLMFSLPPKWVFSEKNLTELSSDGMSGVRTAVQELKEKKYLKIEQSRDEKGHLGRSVYYFYRMPYDIERKTVSPEVEIPHTDIPHTEKPLLEKPSEDKPLMENNIQTKTNIKTNTIINKDYSSSDKTYENMKKKVMDNIGYAEIVNNNNFLEEQLEDDEITLEEFDNNYVNEKLLETLVRAMTELYISKTGKVQIGQGSYSKYKIIDSFEAMSYKDLREVINITKNAKPKNKSAYMLKVIANY